MPRFGELEVVIMDVVWGCEHPLLVRDVVETIRRERSVAFTTVQTVMEILYRKGWLTREKQGRAYRYSAARPREEYTAQLLGEALDTTTDRGRALSLLLPELEPDELDELRHALTAAKRKASSANKKGSSA